MRLVRLFGECGCAGTPLANGNIGFGGVFALGVKYEGPGSGKCGLYSVSVTIGSGKRCYVCSCTLSDCICVSGSIFGRVCSLYDGVARLPPRGGRFPWVVAGGGTVAR